MIEYYKHAKVFISLKWLKYLFIDIDILNYDRTIFIMLGKELKELILFFYEDIDLYIKWNINDFRNQND